MTPYSEQLDLDLPPRLLEVADFLLLGADFVSRPLVLEERDWPAKPTLLRHSLLEYRWNYHQSLPHTCG